MIIVGLLLVLVASTLKICVFQGVAKRVLCEDTTDPCGSAASSCII